MVQSVLLNRVSRMQNPEHYFTADAIALLRRAIQENDGQEVFCVGTLDASQRVATVRVVARGNENCVPAVLEAALPGTVAIHNHPGGRLSPSDNDLFLAGELGAAAVASYIVDNEVTRLHVAVEPFRAKEIHELSDDPILKLFAPGGELAAKFPGFELRPQQVRMAQDVITAFNQRRVALVEAGTGVGKSLAYLIPAVRWALENKQRVVVSTNTINLQEQLIHKDLPFLQQDLRLDFTAVLMKGRSNYLCLRKAYDVKREPSQIESTDQGWELGLIFEWMEKTGDGSRSDLSFNPTAENWELLACEADNCSRARCPHFSRCFFFQARRAATRAQIIITNHHLLMADLAVRMQTGRPNSGILPAFHKLILDEAHHLEDVAASYLGAHITPYGFYRNLGRLQSPRSREKGLVPGLGAILYRLMSPDNQLQVARIHECIEDVFTPARAACRKTLENIFTGMVDNMLRCEELALVPGEEFKKRISPDVESTPIWTTAIRPAILEIMQAVDTFGASCQKLLKLVYDLDKPTLDHLESILLDIEALVLRLKVQATALGDFLEEGEDQCRWMELKKRKEQVQVSFRQAPLDVAKRLKELVFEAYESVILTSATLAVGQTFGFIEKRTGLDLLSRERLLEEVLDSPYDYAHRVLLGIPTDFPDPAAKEFLENLVDLIGRAVAVTGGNTFILFTSYGLLNAAFRQLEGPLLLNGFTCLRQGQMNRHKLLEEFKTRGRSVLFGTDSFWEGVDVKGEALQCVIIPKLPFQVPTEPIVEARIQKIEREGGHPFLDYTVPHAIIKLKQGFGRLIRSREDWGLVLICDRRVLTKSYGRLFLGSLPKCRQRAMSTRALLGEIRDFRSLFVRAE